MKQSAFLRLISVLVLASLQIGYSQYDHGANSEIKQLSRMPFDGCTNTVDTSIGRVICKKISCNTTERLVSRAFGIGQTWFGSYPTVACIVRKRSTRNNISATVTTSQIITAIKNSSSGDLVKAGSTLSISARLPVSASGFQLTYTGKVEGMEYNSIISTNAKDKGYYLYNSHIDLIALFGDTIQNWRAGKWVAYNVNYEFPMRFEIR
ncbi:hypothetical protein AYI70_g10084 [Smittium culicis]|uniref:Uncharacterized protein n=2 Tax=Smittium culicis TaxID=133412 RepID=A0A1R1X024_9FUNG|nr:hypothetical protein AYI70_g11856 [Smittium culicis]OMJ10828.1 hypothetical protein AYI70_g10084 [Smittium culicis]